MRQVDPLRAPRWSAVVPWPLTPRRALRLIALVTLVVTLISGATIRVVDGREFPTLGRALWWAAQTVSTVGYGDVVPEATAGRAVAVVVMLNAIGLVTVVTGALTALLIDGMPKRQVADASADARLDEILERLERLRCR